MTARAIATVVLLLGLSGCPRDVQEPEPGEATPCSSVERCNGGLSCAPHPLRACVDGLCEATPSLVAPCRVGADAGT